MANVFPKNLAQGLVASTAAAVLTHDGSPSKKIRVDSILVHNNSGGSLTLKAYLVPNNAGAVGTAADTNQFYEAAIADAATVEILADGKYLVLEDANDTIQMGDAAGTGLRYFISGTNKH